MRDDTLGATVWHIELLHAVLVAALWMTLVPARIVETKSLFIGAAFMGINFLLLGCGIHWALTPFAGKGRVKTGITLLVMKMILFLGLVSVLLFRFRLDPLSFALGITTLLFAIICERIWACV
jgi:hypothetical protein